MPALTIGMPVYNGERYIREALDSLLAQSFTDFELIISDNASEDRTGAICEEYARKDARVRYIRQSKNRGAFANFEFVLELARGEYFMWAAYDDYWAPNFISECVGYLKAHADTDFAVTKYRVISRLFPLFNRAFLPDLSFVADDDPRERVLSFARLPISGNKDNIAYALWRRGVILGIVSDLKKASVRRIIGGPMNEYALALYKGGFINKVLFIKKYPSLIAGHFLYPPLLSLNDLLAFMGKPVKRAGIETARRQQSQYLIDIVNVLKLTGFDDGFIDKVAGAYKPAFRHLGRAEEWRSLIGKKCT